ncbi:MAG TPA: hypothetical protein VGA42_08000 [Gemmatimonadales bacterium]
MPLRAFWLSLALVWVACGGDGPTPPPPPPPPGNCVQPATAILSPGQHTVLSPAASAGCVRVPAPGAEAEYLVAVVSGAGQVTESGISGPYVLKAGAVASAAPPVAVGPSLQTAGRPSIAETFHLTLRERERELGADPSNRPSVSLAPGAAPPPVVGSERSFSVCENIQCSSFDTVAAVARYVGTKAAVYLDKTVPTADPLTQADLDDLGTTFDQFHYPIDLNAFGAESDIDANSVIAILLTDAVNALTPDCTDGRILGFFFGGDLLDVAGSNHGEVFYGMVPAPATPTCTAAGRQQTVDRLKPVLIHELQHMISFNQHVLVRSGENEVTWLNEGLSHFAEELAGQLIPNSECPGFVSCRSQYVSSNLFDAYDYLEDTEAHFLVSPGSSSGTLPERGAEWLFVRWLADQFGTDTHGTNVTRGLVQTTQLGFQNVQTVTGEAFPILVAEWLLATYLDDLPGFTAASPRLRYDAWGFRQVFQANCCTPTAPFPNAFPTNPPLITGSSTRSGTLRGGSGRHFRILLSPSSPAFDLLLTRNTAGQAIDPALEARIGIARIR